MQPIPLPADDHKRVLLGSQGRWWPALRFRTALNKRRAMVKTSTCISSALSPLIGLMTSTRVQHALFPFIFSLSFWGTEYMRKPGSFCSAFSRSFFLSSDRLAAWSRCVLILVSQILLSVACSTFFQSGNSRPMSTRMGCDAVQLRQQQETQVATSRFSLSSIRYSNFASFASPSYQQLSLILPKRKLQITEWDSPMKGANST